VRVRDFQTRLETSASSKGQGSAESIVGNVLTRESHDVAVQVRKDAEEKR